MGKRSADSREEYIPPSAPASADYSLEEILAEYRSKPVWEQETPRSAESAAREASPAGEVPEPEKAAAPAAEAAEPSPDGTEVWRETVDGFEDDAPEYARADAVPPGEGGEERDEDGEFAPEKLRVHRGGKRAGARGLLDGLTALLTVASFRRHERRSQKEPEPEDNDAGLPPAEAARFYAGQIPSLKRRCRAAFVVCALPVWLSLAYALGWPLPGSLDDVRAAALVSLTALLAVMLLGLDVITSGVLSLFRGRPGAETLVAGACLGSAAESVYVAAAPENLGQLPPCAVPCLAVAFALLGAWLTCRGYRAGFLALSRAKTPFSVTSERLLNRKYTFLIRSQQATEGFVRRSEEPDVCETVSAALAPFVLVAVPVLAALTAVQGRNLGVFFHSLATLSAVGASWCALTAFPMLFSRAAAYFRGSGAALAGWSGVRDVGAARHLILTDADLFPAGTVAITGVKILEGVFTDKVVSCTGSMLAAAGTELAGIFTELMQRSGGTMRPVEDFAVGEGGAKAFIGGEEVFVGCAGYMHLQGVKISPKQLSGDAIYTAFSGSLVGIFNVTYTATPSVREALLTLQKSRRKPIFAVRDFNIDPLLIKEKFHCSTEGFEFPAVPERFRISGLPASGERPVAAVLAMGGLGRLVELSARGKYLYYSALTGAGLTVGGTLLGLALAFLLCWGGAWAAVSAARLLLYMLLWLLPMWLFAAGAGQ